MITRIRHRLAPSPSRRAAAGLAAYETHLGHPPALAVLLGFRQTTDRKRHLVDGPQRLAVVTADTIALVDPQTGAIRRDAPLEQLAAYLIDSEGRFIIRFDTAQGASQITGFRAVAAPDPALTTFQAADQFVRRAITAWETRTGRPFTNTWTAPSIAASC